MRAINKKRAKKAQLGIEAFMYETGLTKYDGLDTAISDFLADLLHLCDLKKMDYEELMERGRRHYEAEQTKRGDEG